jgi:uncharacterized membrane protein
MSALLANLKATVIAGFVLAVGVFLIYFFVQGFDGASFWPFLIRWLHVICGIMWIGLLWYFNFVQTPTMPSIPAELKPGVSKYIAPQALFWFRWGAMGTIIFGLILAWMNGYIVQAITIDAIDNFAVPQAIVIGIGMWLGTIMWFNVWFVIWPNQQKALGLNGKDAGLTPEAKAAAGKTAGQFSRINTLLSIPMLFCMVSAQNLFGSTM